MAVNKSFITLAPGDRTPHEHPWPEDDDDLDEHPLHHRVDTLGIRIKQLSSLSLTAAQISLSVFSNGTKVWM
jgi:hypothetical protein